MELNSSASYDADPLAQTLSREVETTAHRHTLSFRQSDFLVTLLETEIV